MNKLTNWPRLPAGMPKNLSSSSTTPPRPAHHANNEGTAFKNPWPSAEAPTWSEILSTSKFPIAWYEDLAKKHPGTRDVKVVMPDWGGAYLRTRGLSIEECVVGTVLGHAGAVVELPLEGTRAGKSTGRGLGKGEREGGKEKFYILFDPIFSDRAGPTKYTGTQRMRPSPCQVEDLPGCDVVMISHNHYDHLDLPTISALFKKFPHAKYFVPLGNKSWLRSLGIAEASIVEMDWWGITEWSVEDLGYNLQDEREDNERSDTRLRFTCVPAQHNSGRGGFDQGTTLWSGWAIEQFIASPSQDGTASSPSHPGKISRKGAVYHAGDTGYRRSAGSPSVCPIFKEIGAKFGGFDLAFIPIWRGGSLGFISYLGLRLGHDEIPSALHASPADALDIHGDVKSRHSVGVHFGTWVGSVNESLEAVVEFEIAREKRGVGMLDDKDTGEKMGEKGRAGILDIGGSFAVEIQAEEVQS